MSPSPIKRPVYGPIACGSSCGSHPATASQAPKKGRVSSDSSLASLIVILCALEALLIWAAFEGVANAFLLFAQIAFFVAAAAGYRFCRWVFEDEEGKPSDSWSTFSERLGSSRTSGSVAGALGAGAIGLGSSRKGGSKSSDSASAGCAASFGGGSDGGGSASSCGGGCSCGGGASCGGGC